MLGEPELQSPPALGDLGGRHKSEDLFVHRSHESGKGAGASYFPSYQGETEGGELLNESKRFNESCLYR